MHFIFDMICTLFLMQVIKLNFLKIPSSNIYWAELLTIAKKDYIAIFTSISMKNEWKFQRKRRKSLSNCFQLFKYELAKQ